MCWSGVGIFKASRPGRIRPVGFSVPIIRRLASGRLSLEIFNDGLYAPPTSHRWARRGQLTARPGRETVSAAALKRPRPSSDTLFDAPAATEQAGIEFSSLPSTTTWAPNSATAGARLGLPRPASIAEECQPAAPGRYQPDPQQRTLFLAHFEAHGPPTVCHGDRACMPALWPVPWSTKGSPIALVGPMSWNWARRAFDGSPIHLVDQAVAERHSCAPTCAGAGGRRAGRARRTNYMAMALLKQDLQTTTKLVISKFCTKYTSLLLFSYCSKTSCILVFKIIDKQDVHPLF